MDFVEICPPVVVAHVRGTDLAVEASHRLFAWMRQEASPECRRAALAEIAGRLDGTAHPAVVEAFAAAVAGHARFLPAATLQAVAEAYGRMPYAPEIARTYFHALRVTGIDVRDMLRGRLTEDWSFAQPYSGAATWHYYLYLASLGEPGALEALADRIARTERGNETALFLRSLAQLPGDAVTEVLRAYAEDPRRVDGMTGPGAPVSVIVAGLLAAREPPKGGEDDAGGR